MRLPSVVVIAALLCLPPVASAQVEKPPEISEMVYLDRNYMAQQRTLINDVARRYFGQGFNGNKDADLKLLQRLLDKRLVRANQTQELQAMGLVMGDLLQKELEMEWVIYEDSEGRSRALRYPDTSIFLFPMTMISRRVEVGNTTPVTEIYQKAYDSVAPLRPALPFQ